MQQFARPLQVAVNSFAHGSVSIPVPNVGEVTAITLNKPHIPTALRRRDGFSDDLGIAITLRVKMDDRDGPYVETVGYTYTLFVDEVERVRYDWHPEVGVSFPHMHVNDGVEHIPTGRVLVEDFLICCIEFGAKPNDQWKQLLSGSYEAFVTTASWGIPEPSRPHEWLDRWNDQGDVMTDDHI